MEEKNLTIHDPGIYKLLHVLWHAGACYCIAICAVREYVEAAIIQDGFPHWPHWHNMLCERWRCAGFALCDVTHFHLLIFPPEPEAYSFVSQIRSDRAARTSNLLLSSAAAGLIIMSHVNLNFCLPCQLHFPFALLLPFHFIFFFRLHFHNRGYWTLLLSVSELKGAIVGMNCSLRTVSVSEHLGQH